MHGRPSVLLVDQGGGVALAPTLERCGFTVTTSTTPETALFEFGQHAFDAVVATLPLPGMGSAGLCQEVRRRGRTPVLIATSGGGTDWRAALHAGADDHVSMPCDERVLWAHLQGLIRGCRGPLSPQRVVRVGELVIRLGYGAVVTVEPALPLTPVQSTLLSHFAGNERVVQGEDALADRVRAVHGSISDVQFEAELHGLQAAVAVASGVSDALQHLDGIGWRLAADAT